MLVKGATGINGLIYDLSVPEQLLLSLPEQLVSAKEQLQKCSGVASNVYKQLVSVPEQSVSTMAHLRECSGAVSKCSRAVSKSSGAVTKVFRSSYEMAPEQLISLPEHFWV